MAGKPFPRHRRPLLGHRTLSAVLELEYELRRYLHQPRVSRSDDCPEGSRRQIRAYAVGIKLRVIKDVVGLESELHSRPLRNCGVFVEHEVPVVNPGAPDWISRCVTIRNETRGGNPDCRTTGRTANANKGAGIEPHPRGVGIQIMYRSHLVGSVPTIEVRGHIATPGWV